MLTFRIYRVSLLIFITNFLIPSLFATENEESQIPSDAVCVLKYKMEEKSGRKLIDNSLYKNDATAIALPYTDVFKWISRKNGGYALKIGNDPLSKKSNRGAFIPHSESLLPEKFIIEFDIKPYSLASGRPKDILAAQVTSFYHKKLKPGKREIHYPIRIYLYKRNGNRLQIFLSLSDVKGSITKKAFSPLATLPIDDFTKVKIVFNQDELKIYFDNKAVGNWKCPSKIVYDHPDYYPGHVSFKLGSGTFDGELDNFAIYDTAIKDRKQKVGLKISTDKYLNFFAADEEKEITVGISSFDSHKRNGILKWEVLDHNDRIIATGEKELSINPMRENDFKIVVPSDLRGCFRIQCSYIDADGSVVKREDQYSVGAIRNLHDYPASSPFGIDAAEPHSQISTIPDLGMKWARPWLGWHYIEPEDGVWEWENADRIINYHHDKGRKILISLYGTPSWAVSEEVRNKLKTGEIRDKRKLAHYLPVDKNRRKQYLEKIISRYRDKVDVWEVWNEANTGYWQGTPEEFIEMMKQAHDVIRKLDPTAKIAGPSICKAGWEPFSSEILALGAAKYMDIFVVHYIGGGYTRVEPEMAVSEIDDTKKMIRTYGKDLPIWDGEFGFHLTSRNPANNKPYTPEEIEKMKSLREKSVFFSQRNYDRCVGEIKGSNAFVRKVVISLSKGVNKHFRHNVGRMKYESDVRAGNYIKGTGLLLPAIAWTAMVEKLADSEFIRKIDLGDHKLYGYLFRNRKTSKNVAVFWASEGFQDVTLTNLNSGTGIGSSLLKIASLGTIDSAGIEKYDIWGNPVELPSTKGGRLQVKLTEAPFYLEGVGGDIKMTESILKIEDLDFVSSGKSEDLKITAFNPADKKAEGTVKINTPAGVKVEPKQYQVNLEPGQKKSKKITLTVSPDFQKDKVLVEFSFESPVTAKEIKSSVLRITQPAFPCMEKTAQIIIDGNIDDKGWLEKPVMKLDDEKQVVIGRPLCYADPATIVKDKEWYGPEDLVAEARVCHDEKNLYLFVKVIDNSIRVNERDTRPFLGDSVELFIDARPEENQTKVAYSPGVFHLVFVPGDEKDSKATWVWNRAKAKDKESWPLKLCSKVTKDGYVIEAKIPLDKKRLPLLNLKNGRILGLDICVNDADGQNTRKSQISWRGTKENYRDASAFGKIVIRK